MTLTPGIYRGGSPAEFGLWRLRPDGVWLFCMPVEGSVWRRAADQSGDGLIRLGDAPADPPAVVDLALTQQPGARVRAIAHGVEAEFVRTSGGAWCSQPPIDGKEWHHSADLTVLEVLPDRYDSAANPS